MIDPRAGDPLYVAGPEPVISERPRWPLILAIVVVIGVVVALLFRGPAATMPSAEPGAMRQAAAREENGSHPIIRPESPRQGWSSSSVPSPLTGSETAGSAASPVPPLPDTATSVVGVASWFCRPPKYPRCTRGVPASSYAAAAGPALRVGDWRGRIVKVCAVGGRCVRVRLSDWCACPRRVVDLYHSAFAAIASPSRGVVRVEVTWGASTRVVLPPTSTEVEGSR